MGRPSIYSEEIVTEICDRIADGESLRNICRDDHLPDRATILRWLDSHGDFAAKYARAREFQGDVLDERMMEEADLATNDDWQVRRLRITTMQWRASKLAPKKYGDRLELAGEVGINSLTDEQIDAKLTALMAKQQAEKQP